MVRIASLNRRCNQLSCVKTDTQRAFVADAPAASCELEGYTRTTGICLQEDTEPYKYRAARVPETSPRMERASGYRILIAPTNYRLILVQSIRQTSNLICVLPVFFQPFATVSERKLLHCHSMARVVVDERLGSMYHR